MNAIELYNKYSDRTKLETSSNTGVQCLQTMNKTSFESLSCDFSWFKEFVVSVTNLFQGQLNTLYKSRKREITQKPTQSERNLPFQNIN